LTSKFAQTLTKTWQAEKTAIGRFQKRTSKEPSAYTKDYGFPTDFKEFNKMIGYPINRNTNKSSPMTPYQIEYHNAIQKHHKVIVDKSRKIGITEAAIRSIGLNIFHRYAGHDIMIIAGNELKIANEILLRLYELFKDKPDLGYAFKHNGIKWKEFDLIRRVSINGQHPIIEFRNGTRVFCFAASRSGKSQSFRGPDDIIAILFSEAAHTGMLEDQPIMNALEPNLANRDSADIILESTPNGRRGFFFQYWMDIEEKKLTGWKRLKFDYKKGLKHKVLSEKYLTDQKSNLRVDFAQEYECKFTSSVTAIFREEDINILPEWEHKSIDLLKSIGEKDTTMPERDTELEE